MQLELKQLGYNYGDSKTPDWAVENLNLSLNSGDFLGIIGHSGSGKSTLVQMIAGLLKPSSGSILLDGIDITLRELKARLFCHIGLVFQYPETQLFAPTVAEDVAFAAQNAGWSRQRISERVPQVLAELGLNYDALATRSPFSLSGGEQRRVALAGVMVIEPDILILDEPTAGLDPKGKRRVLSLIRDYHQAGHSVILVSHSMEDIALLANRLLVMNHGQEFLQGSPEEVFLYADELHEINLGVPESEAFARELRASGLALPEPLLTLEALADALAKMPVHAPASIEGGRKGGRDGQ